MKEQDRFRPQPDQDDGEPTAIEVHTEFMADLLPLLQVMTSADAMKSPAFTDLRRRLSEGLNIPLEEVGRVLEGLCAKLEAVVKRRIS